MLLFEPLLLSVREVGAGVLDRFFWLLLCEKEERELDRDWREEEVFSLLIRFWWKGRGAEGW